MHLRFHEISKHSLTITASRLQNNDPVKMQGHKNRTIIIHKFNQTHCA